MSAKRKPGRPKGSKTSSLETVEEPARCANCGSTKMKVVKTVEKPAVGVRPMPTAKGIQNVRHTSKVWKVKRCDHCGANQTVHISPYDPALWPDNLTGGIEPNGKE